MMEQRVVVVLTIATTAVLATAKFIHSYFSKIHYKKSGKVEQLIIYPIKSLPGFSVDSLEMSKNCVKYGKHYDREWVLMDEKGLMITQRTEPSLSGIKIRLEDDKIILNADNMDELEITRRANVANGDLIYPITIWQQDTEGIDAGDKVSQWFSKYLGKPNVRLIQYNDALKTRIGKWIENNKLIFKNELSISYQDGANILLINDTSVDDLKKRINDDKLSLDYRRFRPNILTATSSAYDEDHWKFVKIGESEFKVIMPCGRCVLTTVDPDTGTFGEEPLRTLRQYRLGDENIYGTNTPLMGIYMNPFESNKTISLGDHIHTA